MVWAHVRRVVLLSLYNTLSTIGVKECRGLNVFGILLEAQMYPNINL